MTSVNFSLVPLVYPTVMRLAETVKSLVRWTAYRLIPNSSCTDGERPDRCCEHRCPGFQSHGAWFWLFMLLFGLTTLIYMYRICS